MSSPILTATGVRTDMLSNADLLALLAEAEGLAERVATGELMADPSWPHLLASDIRAYRGELHRRAPHHYPEV